MYHICVVIQHTRSLAMQWQALCGSCQELEQITLGNGN